MLIVEKMKEDLDFARKGRMNFRVKVLSTLLGNIQSKATPNAQGVKVATDEVAIASVKSHLKGLKELAAYTFTDDVAKEIKIVEDYLPVQLTVEALTKIKKEHKPKSIPEFMNILKAGWPNMYDGKLAVEVFKAPDDEDLLI